MENTLLIQVTNKKAIRLLYDMEDLNLIKVLNKEDTMPAPKLSKKYKGVFSKEDALSFEKHSQSMRKEWYNI